VAKLTINILFVAPRQAKVFFPNKSFVPSYQGSKGERVAAIRLQRQMVQIPLLEWTPRTSMC